MRFYMKARAEDFIFDEERMYGYIPEEKQLVRQGDFRKGAGAFRDVTGRGYNECFNILSEYEAYVVAKRDFENGEAVYVDYKRKHGDFSSHETN
ncbi:hypothetical protein IMZ31_23420 (plasmid) [Pontibacillus sp. ALD_SL1]|uniref:hypothetical protein n=1 Tax=Pontibacillus sp. ALD_SL1 TaxID=2777185 RepID=UPI001A96295E|nr:hypothetical protein [Pontibacillus sp. ALD_SL1]QST02403.1 hypothetical protein IMZ31_23420 [Pontibacillus sp. ALD_SL1]